jgi:hypothetical protein
VEIIIQPTPEAATLLFLFQRNIQTQTGFLSFTTSRAGVVHRKISSRTEADGLRSRRNLPMK